MCQQHDVVDIIGLVRLLIGGNMATLDETTASRGRSDSDLNREAPAGFFLRNDASRS